MYGVVTTVPAPVEMYDRMHAELIKRTGTSVDGFGLLVHVGRATADGFERFEVWESKEHYDRAMEIAGSLMRDLAGDLPQPSTEQSTEVFEVRGIVNSPRRHRDIAAIRAGNPGPATRSGRHTMGHAHVGLDAAGLQGR